MMNRIVIIGATGSGKSRLAKTLSEKFGHTVIELDDLYWNPGWKPSSDAEFEQRILHATPNTNWIMTGNYTRFHHITWEKADTLIWLDYNLLINLWHLVKRTTMRMFDKRPICNGNYETPAHVFSKDSIFVWLFKSYGRRKRDNTSVFNDNSAYPHITKIRLTSRRDCRNWLKTLPQ